MHIRLSSTRNILDSVSQDFTLVIAFLASCDVVLPAQDSFAEMTALYLINFDTEKVIEVASQELDF